MTLLDEVRRFLVDDARRRVTDPKPLYATAGAVDAAVGFVRGLPVKLESAAEKARTEWTPDRFGDAFTDLVDDLKDRADDANRKLEQQRAVLADPAKLVAAVRTAAGEAVDDARRAPGRIAVGLAEQAGAAFETYDELADRGRGVLARLRGDATPGESPTGDQPARDPAAPPVFRRPTSPDAPADPPSPPPTAADGVFADPDDVAPQPLAEPVAPAAPTPRPSPGPSPAPGPSAPSSRSAPPAPPGEPGTVIGAGAVPPVRPGGTVGHATGTVPERAPGDGDRDDVDGAAAAPPNAATRRPGTASPSGTGHAAGAGREGGGPEEPGGADAPPANASRRRPGTPPFPPAHR